MSLTSTQSLIERRTDSCAGSLYLLPSNKGERQRLFMQHQLYTRLLSGRLIIPPIHLSDKDEVLDVGTGSGAWLCDVRTRLPDSVQLYGLDIESRLFPGYTALSTNMHLSICSTVNLPSYWTSKFTLVHQRLLVFAYPRDHWRRSIDEIYRVLKPGGYAQLIEVGPGLVSGFKTAKHMLFLDDFLGSKGMLLRCVIYIADMMKAAGFVDVKCEGAVMNLGTWAGEDGVQAKNTILGAWGGMRHYVMEEGGLGQFASTEELEKTIDAVGEEWDSIEGSHTTVKVFYARKPL